MLREPPHVGLCSSSSRQAVALWGMGVVAIRRGCGGVAREGGVAGCMTPSNLARVAVPAWWVATHSHTCNHTLCHISVHIHTYTAQHATTHTATYRATQSQSFFQCARERFLGYTLDTQIAEWGHTGYTIFWGGYVYRVCIHVHSHVYPLSAHVPIGTMKQTQLKVLSKLECSERA